MFQSNFVPMLYRFRDIFVIRNFYLMSLASVTPISHTAWYENTTMIEYVFGGESSAVYEFDRRTEIQN